MRYLLLYIFCFFYVSIFSWGQTVSSSVLAPSSDVISFSSVGVTNAEIFDENANDDHARGQLFSLPDVDGGVSYQISTITVKKSTTQTFNNDTITLRIFEGTQGQWDSGSGHETSEDGNDYYVGSTVVPLYVETFTLSGTLIDNHYITFKLATPFIVNEESDFGFLMTYEKGGGAADSFNYYESSAEGGSIVITTTAHSTSTTQKIVYYVQGSSLAAPVLALASPFQDRMVLQRGKPVKIWGTSAPSAAVSVSMNGSNVNGTADALGEWQVEFPSQSAGGPYSLVVTSGGATETVNDVLVGDVWLCFGQSNMEYTLDQTDSWHTTYENAIIANDNIRCLKIDQDAALTEQKSASMNWLDNSTAGSWSAVGSVFAHQLHTATNVPVAIVWAAWGSSCIEGWMPLELREQLPHYDEMMNFYQSSPEYNSGDLISNRKPSAYSTNEEAIAGLIANGWTSLSNDIFMRTRPNILYNKMIHPMLNYGISGFIWYQGETSAGSVKPTAQYGFSLPKFATEYRKRFDQGDIPFLGVQLPSHATTNWPWFREAQSQLETLNNAHLVATIDTGIATNIHPADKEPIGIRLALLARKYALNESLVAHGPEFDSMSVSGNQVTITFTNATGLNTDVDAGLFQIAGTGSFQNADSIAVSGNQVTISASSVSNPVEVRYAWMAVPSDLTVLKNSSGLVAPPFRTDSFAVSRLSAQAPQGVTDVYEVAQNTVLNVPVAGVLTNDIDLNRDSLTASLVTNVSHGSLTFLADGSFTYTPHSGFAGVDSFTYTSNDGSLTSENTMVMITVTGTQSGYYAWRNTVGWTPSNDQAEDGDPDSDGIENFLEFAFGLDPLVADAEGLPKVSDVNASFVYYDFNNAREGLVYEVLLSNDLDTWTDPPFAILTHNSNTPIQIPRTQAVAGKLFIRLRVSE